MSAFISLKKTLFFSIAIILLSSINQQNYAQRSASKDTVKSTPDTLLFKIEKAQSIITEINSSNKRGFNIAAYRKNLENIENNIAPVKQELEITTKTLDSKTLQSFGLILKDSQEKLAEMRDALSKSNGELQQMTDEVVTLSGDSLLKVNAKDTTEKKLYNQQLNSIKLKLEEVGKFNSSNLDTVAKLLADVSATYLVVVDLQEKISELQFDSGKNSFKKESPYLWAAPKQRSLGESIGELLKSSYQGQNKILSYFINSTWDSRVFVIFIGLFFFYWVYKNIKKATTSPLKQKIGDLNFEYLKKYPILATLLFILSITPLFELDSPALYIELVQFLLLITVTIHFWKILSKTNLTLWLIMVVLYLTLIFTNAIITDALFSRLLLISINIGFIYLGIRFSRKLKAINLISKYLRPIMIMYFSFNTLSILLNIFGRISLAKVFSTTAIISITHVICLALFVQILTEVLELKLKISTQTEGLLSRLNANNVRATFKKLFRYIAVILWLVVFTINLNLTSGVLNILKIILSKPRSFGSISFTLTNVLFFLVIVYVANKLQKHVGILFEEKTTGFDGNNKHKSSKAALMRLIIIFIGVLFAVTASGIPLDKLTVVLGALSVGIGLGMQNIVNNFVSGIILIFEKPFRIGDYIELADKKGKIQDIGIRSSKMLTSEGSEVIIPNGDLLSGRLVNWTLSNDYIKSEITFKVKKETDLVLLKKIIKDEVSKLDHTLKNRDPEVLISNISADSIELKITTWITNIYQESSFKNQLYMLIINKFKDNEINLM